MASERTLALRGSKPNPPRIITQGPTMAELLSAGKVLSANRANRLATEAKLPRAQRMELREKRRTRKFDGIEPSQPEWAKPQPEKPLERKMLDQVCADVAELFERGIVAGEGTFDEWKAQLAGETVMRAQLDLALAEITRRLEEHDTNQGVTDGG